MADKLKFPDNGGACDQPLFLTDAFKHFNAQMDRELQLLLTRFSDWAIPSRDALSRSTRTHRPPQPR